MASLAPTYAALDIIKGALRAINGLASGESPDASTAQDALLILNNMLDSWNAQRLLTIALNRQVFPLVIGKQVYTMGPGGDFDVPRPAKIDQYGLILPNAQPAELSLTAFSLEDWARIIVKVLPTTLPYGVYDDDAYPLRNLTFWGVPNSSLSVAIYNWAPLSRFATLTTQLGFPEGYQEAILYNLAVRLAAQNFGEPVTAEIAALAIQSLAVVKISNIEAIDLRCDPAMVGDGTWGRSLKGGFNIFTG